MRMAILASLAGALIGCGGAHVDNTMNRGTNPSDPTYPAGPYGYAKGSIIQDLQLQGKTDPNGAAGTAVYANVAMDKISFSAFHDDKTVGWLLLSGSAGWCVPCRQEAAEIRKISPKWEAKGVRFVTVLIQGFDETAQNPATAGDIDRWQALLQEHIGIAIDPSDQLHQFSSEIASFPLNILIRTYDMAIINQSLGIDPNNGIDSLLSGYVQ